jgi:hypothetical protein
VTRWYRYAVAGAALGLLWGVLARLWMRYVSDAPEFSWSGTGFILGAATVAGTSLAMVEWARRTGRSRWWRSAGLGVLGLGMGPGSFMVPTVVLGALALSGRGPAALRLVAGLLGLAPLAVLVGMPTPHSKVLSLAGYVVLVAAEALAFSALYRRRHARERSGQVALG